MRIKDLGFAEKKIEKVKEWVVSVYKKKLKGKRET
jgi:hypothetical protein